MMTTCEVDIHISIVKTCGTRIVSDQTCREQHCHNEDSAMIRIDTCTLQTDTYAIRPCGCGTDSRCDIGDVVRILSTALLMTVRCSQVYVHTLFPKAIMMHIPRQELPRTGDGRHRSLQLCNCSCCSCSPNLLYKSMAAKLLRIRLIANTTDS